MMTVNDENTSDVSMIHDSIEMLLKIIKYWKTTK